MSTLPQLEEKIYSLVPELKELTFGCEVRIKNDTPSGAMMEYGWDEDKGYGIDVVVRVTEEDYIEYDGFEFTFDDILKGEEEDWYFEIIGHEILPSHWLPLIGDDYAISGGGHIVKNDYNRSYTYQTKYDFKKSFKDQSPEFHQFLLENIK